MDAVSSAEGQTVPRRSRRVNIFLGDQAVPFVARQQEEILTVIIRSTINNHSLWSNDDTDGRRERERESLCETSLGNYGSFTYLSPHYMLYNTTDVVLILL